MDLCQLCYHMLDLVGFFQWAACVFDKEIKCNIMKVVTETYKWLNENFTGRNIGYLMPGTESLDSVSALTEKFLSITPGCPPTKPCLGFTDLIPIPWVLTQRNQGCLLQQTSALTINTCRMYWDLTTRQLIYIGCSGKLPTLSTLRDGPGTDFDQRRCILI